MEQKENQRIMLTKQLLQNAILQLLKRVPLHDISIRELCKEAGINRTTFYNHYGSQYDLLGDISQRFLDSIAERLESADFSDRENVHRRGATVLEYIAENRELSIQLINNNIDLSFAERIFSLPKIGDLLEAALGNCRDERKRAATVSFVIHGNYKLLQDWINQEDRLSPIEQTEIMLDLAQRVCRQRDLT